MTTTTKTHRADSGDAKAWRAPRGAWLALCVVVATATGCEMIGFAAHVIGGDSAKKVTVMPAYNGLDNQSVAVLVAADEYTLFEYPGVAEAVCREVSAQLVGNIPGVRVLNPQQASRFQQENHFWSTMPYQDLMARLGVQRMIYLDLVQYATHEPGNTYVRRGVMVANLGVAEANADAPNDFVFATTLRAQYPQGAEVKLLEQDDQTIRLGLLRSFSLQLVNQFREHQVVKP